ncbi:MAG: peptidase C25 [Thermoplasmata archaeon]|nr:peptidase C25 [Thermoplasmata archaeon]
MKAKNLIVVGVVFLLILSYVGAMPDGGREKNVRIYVPSVGIVPDSKGNVELKVEGASYMYSPGKPVMPVINRVIELPFAVEVKDVRVSINGIHEEKINGKVKPSPGPIPLLPYMPFNMNIKWYFDKSIYNSMEPFPSSWYTYRVGCGLNEKGEHVTFVSIHIYPVRYAPALNKISVISSADVKIEYGEPKITLSNHAYELVIITPPEFEKEATRLAQHKNSVGVPTITVTTDEIYSKYNGRDKPEQIKYFIKDAIEKWGIRYVLLFGGLKTTFWAKARDNANEGSSDWYVPVRYTNLYDNPKYPLGETIHDPGEVSDLYYADIYKAGGEFSSWDSNNDGIFAAWNKPGVENDSIPDLYPDVYVGRLACRSLEEAKTVVSKIINYETGCDDSWFKKMVVVSGDGFLDQQDLNITWDTNNLQDGKYVIYAQSFNEEGNYGPIDETHITIDKSAKTKLTFNHDDYLIPALKNGYPAPPIAKIVSVSNGDVLGKDDYHYDPTDSEAYLNEFFHWANISYEHGVLTIRGKSYDPRPYGHLTNIHVWIENEDGKIVFSAWRNNTEMYYEGEWTTGEREVNGRGGALYYMPSDFEREILWTSNGKFTSQQDVLNAWNEGCGFLFMSGHGSPNVWADHFPGVPGNRIHSSITGLQVTTLKPWYPYFSFPLFPADTLSNGEKLPVAVLGGCHNSQFNVSMVPAFLNIFSLLFPSHNNYMWTYGQPVPECLSWRLVRNPNGGAIASMGNTGLGYGMPGRECTSGGGDSWITIEFFRQYGTEGHKILGDAYEQAITSYINSFDMSDMEAGHVKTVYQWVLLGDPSMMIGGYS